MREGRSDPIPASWAQLLTKLIFIHYLRSDLPGGSVSRSEPSPLLRCQTKTSQICPKLSALPGNVTE